MTKRNKRCIIIGGIVPVLKISMFFRKEIKMEEIKNYIYDLKQMYVEKDTLEKTNTSFRNNKSNDFIKNIYIKKNEKNHTEKTLELKRKSYEQKLSAGFTKYTWGGVIIASLFFAIVIGLVIGIISAIFNASNPIKIGAIGALIVFLLCIIVDKPESEEIQRKKWEESKVEFSKLENELVVIT